MKELTKAEEQIMQMLWKKERAFVREIVEELPPNSKGKKPSYTTVATVFKVLESKGFVNYTVLGNVYQYYPLISKEQYSDTLISGVLNKYFGGSLKGLVSFFVKKDKLELKELNDIIDLIEKNKQDES